MFGKSAWTDRLKEKITEYIDLRFEEYREKLALDISKGLATLAGLIVRLLVIIICLIFVGIALGVLLAELLRAYVGVWAYVVGFSSVAILLVTIGWQLLVYQKKYIEDPVFKSMLEALRAKVADDSSIELKSATTDIPGKTTIEETKDKNTK